MDVSELGALLPWPAADANKYSRGKALLVAGSAAYPGAACLAALATERIGAGYTEVYCAPEAVGALQAFRPTLVVRSWEAWDGEPVATARMDEHRPLAVLVGSGMEADDDEQRRLVLSVLAEAEAPVLVDGGALGALASEEGRAVAHERAERGLPTVLTPHGGEAVRLAHGIDVASEEGDALARALADGYRATVVLKGPRTFIAAPRGSSHEVIALAPGSAALAKAGTGDVLAGMIGGLLAQGIEPMGAAALGVALHGKAGRIAAKRLTAIAVTALDVAESIPEAIASFA